LARPLRQSRLADDLGVVAADAAAGRACGAHRDLDLPQSTTTITAATDRQLGQVRSAAVRVTAVRLTAVRFSPVTGALGITDVWLSRPIGN
jgi:hypothetical protein